MLSKLNTLKTSSIILLTINITIALIFHSLSYFEYYPQDYIYTIYFIFLAFSITCVFQLEKIKVTSLMFIFNITIFVFIGGRFFTYFFDIHTGSLFNLMYMAGYEPTEKNGLYIFNFVIVFILASNIAYLSLIESKRVIKNISKPEKDPNNTILFIAFSVLLLLFAINILREINILRLVEHQGYLARYYSQGKVMESGGSIKDLLFVFIGIVLSIRNKATTNITIILLMLYATIILFSGQRELFVTTFLFGVWYYGIKKNISLYKIILLFFTIAITLLIAMNFSYRSLDSGDTQYLNKLVYLLYNQGVSLGVISYGLTEVADFPDLTYFTSFFPGSFRLFTTINPEILVYPQDVGFGSYTAYTANPIMYQQGYGLGWSIIGNLVLFSAYSKFIFIFLCILWGLFLKKLDSASYYSHFYFGLSAALAPKIFFVARAEIKTVFHTMILYCIVYILLYTLNKILININNHPLTSKELKL